MGKNGNRSLWYRKPAGCWEEALPLGNGRLGGMLFGGIVRDVIRMNEDTFWSGYPKRQEFPDAVEYYRRARDLALEGKYEEAQQVIEEKLTGEFSDCYLPLGDIRMEFAQLKGKAISGYKRYLCLENAVSGSCFCCEGVTYRKEAFISWPEQALYVRLAMEEQKELSFCVSLSSQILSQTAVESRTLVLSGTAPGYAAPDYVSEENPIRYGETDAEKGMRFCMMLSVETDGEVLYEKDRIRVRNAQTAVLRFCAATSFNGYEKHPFTEGKDERKCCSRCLEQAEKKTYEEAKERHCSDYRQYFDRMDWRIADKEERTQLATDERIAAFDEDGKDKGLYELFFHYGRYLLISSSRPGTQATNLQGIWNEQMRAAWSSNYTLNINTQMNYWPAESCGLPEMHEPLFDLIGQLGEAGRKTAEVFYGARGFAVHHNTDIWRFSTPTGRKGKGTARYAFWPMAAGWLCRHLAEHYEYTLDKEFLKERAFPLLKSVSEFYLDVLTENKEGELVFAPSTSPENQYLKDGFHGAIAQSTAMTQSIIREVFEECLAFGEILGECGSFTEEVRRALKKLKSPVIGADGRISEWNEPMEEPEVQHRHLSHLYALYPGRQMNRTDTPEMAEACERSLEKRGDVGTGWSLSWKVAMWARLGNGDRALKLFRKQLQLVKPEADYQNTRVWSGGGVYPNLLDAHPPFQIDGNFGTPAGVTEMYLQSTPKEIRLLPALPGDFGDSVMKGLCVRGRVKADLYVEKGQLQKAVLYTDCTQERILVYKDHREKILLEAGISVIFSAKSKLVSLHKVI